MSLNLVFTFDFRRKRFEGEDFFVVLEVLGDLSLEIVKCLDCKDDLDRATFESEDD